MLLLLLLMALLLLLLLMALLLLLLMALLLLLPPAPPPSLLVLRRDLRWLLRTATLPSHPHDALWQSHTAVPSAWIKFTAKQSSPVLPPWQSGHRVLCWPNRSSGT
jgi:hypothetical protein